MKCHRTSRHGSLLSVGLALVTLLASIPLAAQAGHRHDPGAFPGGQDASLGTVHFSVSCRDAVQERFDRAVALLHHMMYARAREDFEAIAREQPDCAMAHWGVA